MSYLEDYEKYRGKCREFCDALMLSDPTLTLVRGHYFEPSWGRDEAHWWCVNTEGVIIDPTAKQFPNGGIKTNYTEYNGFSDCEECGKTIPEAEIIMQGRYPVCSTLCSMRLVGLA